MDVLVLGGTHHVGRSVVEAALGRSCRVTTVTRGVSGSPPAAVESLRADRSHPGQLEAAIDGRRWDIVVDTWSGAPAAVLEAATLLAGRVGHYAYVSSRSVHRSPIPEGLDESGPVVDADPTGREGGDYPVAKRGGELAVLRGFPDRALIARPGLILGPYERVGRLPWWLRRMERGGDVLAPGPAHRPLQYVDARDLAGWLLSSAEAGVTGVYNTVSRPGHATWGQMLDAVQRVTGGRARLVWAPPEVVLRAGLRPWTELPIWVPPQGELAGLHDGDVTAAMQRGLTCRPVEETVAATWRWLQREGDPPGLLNGRVGYRPEQERRLLDSLLPEALPPEALPLP